VDARDGAVLAAANYPSYDLATYRQDYEKLEGDDLTPLFPRARYGALPTGSVYKVITAIAALQEKRITPDTPFTCEHVFYPDGRGRGKGFECTGHHGSIRLVRAIEKSCNIYFYQTGLKAGGEALARWGQAFGLGAPPGQLWAPRYRYGVVNLSIGQGDLLCTPLQVANAMAAIANGGRLYKTHFFDHAQKLDGTLVRRHEPDFTEVPVLPGTLRVVREGMRKVTQREGTARDAGLDEPFRVAGKTGTAELAEPGLFHAWFAGYAPYDKPRIAFAVVSERTPGHGGSHAAPIMRYALEPIWEEVEAMP
jgi:penicillin-binding protein 2